MARDDWQGFGAGCDEDLMEREAPRMMRASDISGRYAVLDRDFDEDDGWKDDVEAFAPSMGM